METWKNREMRRRKSLREEFRTRVRRTVGAPSAPVEAVIGGA
ncbi:hypothetical protein [Streptomyces sp. NPDC012508]